MMPGRIVLLTAVCLVCGAFFPIVTGCGSTADEVLGSTAQTGTGVLQVQAYTASLGESARVMLSGQSAPDDIDVNLTPTEYTVAFKRIVLKSEDETTGVVSAEVELFGVEAVADALIVDLANGMSSDVLDVSSVTAGTYNKIDVEVFYLDMTVATLYPASTSHDIPYRMVFEDMDTLEQRDLLLYLDPDEMTSETTLPAAVTDAGWYWMAREDPDTVTAVDGAASHPSFNVLDLFADDEFWSSEHKVLEGGWIDPPLEYDPADGGVVTITFDLTGTFNFKDYHDDSIDPDGLWEIRQDAGIHPFPPDIDCSPESEESLPLDAAA